MVYITDFYKSRITGALCITVSAPILDDSGRPIGVLGMDLRFEELARSQPPLSSPLIAGQIDQTFLMNCGNPPTNEDVGGFDTDVGKWKFAKLIFRHVCPDSVKLLLDNYAACLAVRRLAPI